MNIKELKIFLDGSGEPAFRLRQIIKAVYDENCSSFSQISVLSKDLRDKLEQEFRILSLAVEKVAVSKDKQARKALLKLDDGEFIETVLLKSLNNDFSACISSQVGCALGCRFCATGKLGLKRNLSAEEINDQVLFWKQYIKTNKMKGRLSHVVFMGMGEAFLNYEELKQSLDQLLDKGLFNLSSRHISVSTSGIPDGIRRFAKDFPQLNLALSLVSADDEKRSGLMPINKRFSLAELKQALEDYFKTTNRKVFLEYILFDNINDKEIDAQKLIDFVNDCSRPELLHVNLIRYNTTDGSFGPSSRARSEKFKHLLERKRISVSVRKSLGEEIKGACGQLAGE